MWRTSVEVQVQEHSQVGEARRLAQRLAERMGLGEKCAADTAIVTTELATNLARHARDGRLILRADGDMAIEILALDSGPGMDYARCAVDGFSTGGTAGTGLGAVRRQAVEFDVYSSSRGSVLWARVGSGASRQFRIGAINLCHPGEVVCGDDWDVHENEHAITAMVVDGLGHGPQAADAARAGTAMIGSGSPADVLRKAHGRMQGTRGGAAACLRLDCRQGTFTLSSVGNIATTLAGGLQRSRGLPAQHGTLGAHFPSRVDETTLVCHPGAHLVLHSDGISSRWSLDDYPGLYACHPAVIAGVILRDFRRGRDDATVLVMQCQELAA